MSGKSYLDVGHEQTISQKIGNLDQELKYSMVEEDGYNVQWDPEILADLQANVHRQ